MGDDPSAVAADAGNEGKTRAHYVMHRVSALRFELR